ncbi:hypothetical protein C3L33_13578, partial [Rhododendron williamsianum]
MACGFFVGGRGKMEDGISSLREAQEEFLGVDASEQPKIKPHRQRFYPCEVRFLDSVNNLVEPKDYANSTQFYSRYHDREDKPYGQDQFEPQFGGHQTLEEREKSFYARNQTIHCGFVEGPEDEQTLLKLSVDGTVPNDGGYIGLWRIVVVRNLPYKDMRKTGKVPKFLSHRSSLPLDGLLPSSSFPLETCVFVVGLSYVLNFADVPEGSFIDCERRALAKLFSHRVVPPPAAS